MAFVRRNSYEFIDFTWPRVLRVTITNGSQVHLIGEVGLDMQRTDQFDRLVRDAEEQCIFLNAHEVR